jgi:hypothetical protein
VRACLRLEARARQNSLQDPAGHVVVFGYRCPPGPRDIIAVSSSGLHG